MNNLDAYPKVLIISPDSMLSPNGTGLILASLFHDWPPERLANAYFCGNPPPPKVCTHAWQLQSNSLLHRIAAKASRVLLNTRGNCVVPGLDASNGGLSLSVRFGVTCRALADLAGGGIKSPVLQRIRDFKPDIIYSLLWNLTGMQTTEQIARCTGATIVPHFMDDWVSTIYTEALFSVLWRWLINKRLRRILVSTKLRLAICEDMAKDFAKRYGIPFVPFSRCVEDTEALLPRERSNNSIIKLIYVGGLHLGRANTLALVAAATDQLRARGFDAQLAIHSPREEEAEIFSRFLSNYNSAYWAGVLPPEKVAEALSQADIAVHVENFDPRTEAYTRFSLSTKFPSYLAAGLPILAVGPYAIASVRYVERYGIGATVTHPDVVEIAAQLEKLASIDTWRECSHQARSLFFAQHAALVVRSRFSACLKELVLKRVVAPKPKSRHGD